jgi:hypothetical protein
MLQACDFTSLYIPSISPAAAQQLAKQGYALAQIGFDSSPASGNVLAAVLGAGILWDAYRFLSWNFDASQVQSCIDGIHQFSPDEAHLPGYLLFDAEENTDASGRVTTPAPANPAGYFHQLRLYVESRDITPASKVKPGIYSRRSWWETYCPGYTELAEAGWVLWTAEEAGDPDHATGYAGWRGEQIIGVQNRWDLASPIGTVDGSLFRDRGMQPAPNSVMIAGLTATMSDNSVRVLYAAS